jgi:hypothetical protein
VRGWGRPIWRAIDLSMFASDCRDRRIVLLHGVAQGVEILPEEEASSQCWRLHDGLARAVAAGDTSFLEMAEAPGGTIDPAGDVAVHDRLNIQVQVAKFISQQCVWDALRNRALS